MSWLRTTSLTLARQLSRTLDPRHDYEPQACYNSFCKHWQQAHDIIIKSQPQHLHDDVLGVVNHLEQLTTLLVLEARAREINRMSTPATCLEYLLSENLLDKLYEWAICTGKYENAVRLEQLKLFGNLVGHYGSQVIAAEPFLRPLLKLLSGFRNQLPPPNLESQLVAVLNQLCVVLMQNMKFIDLFFLMTQTKNGSQAEFIIGRLLLSSVHIEGSAGSVARDAFLLCAKMSAKCPPLAHCLLAGNACPILATGLSGLYSLLPRSLGVARLTRILNARVPIVKYAHEYAGLHCDLCYNNSAAVHMSALLWQLGELCARARALAVLVRRWAAAAGLTQPHPGRWLTNFPLTLMVLFFLQRAGLLPSLNRLVSEAGKEDIRIAEENVNCTFLRDLNKLPADSYEQNDDDLQTLLFKFFEFYSQFDFQEKAISINEGKAIRKPNSLPLYIVNPLEQSLNVSRNVSYEECERLRLEVRNAAWHLESCLDGKKSDDWGILGLIEQKSSRGLKKLLRVGNSHRLVSMKDLFSDNDDEPSVEGIRSKMQKFVKTDKEVESSVKEMKSEMSKEQKSEKMKFKNNQTASAVYRIRRDKII